MRLPCFESYTFDLGLGFERVREFTLPVAVGIPLRSRADLTPATGYAQVEIDLSGTTPETRALSWALDQREGDAEGGIQPDEEENGVEPRTGDRPVRPTKSVQRLWDRPVELRSKAKALRTLETQSLGGACQHGVYGERDLWQRIGAVRTGGARPPTPLMVLLIDEHGSGEMSREPLPAWREKADPSSHDDVASTRGSAWCSPATARYD